MSLQETEWDDIELSKNYGLILEGKRDISFFTKTNILMLIDFAEQKKFEAIEFIGLLLLGNPDTNFDFWAVRHGNYKNAEFVLNWLRASQIDSKVDLSEKQKPELNVKLITFKNSDTVDNIHSELKGFFPNKEAELLKALQGEQLSEILLFPHNQNKFVEVFRRLKYNGFLLNTDTEIQKWICTTFQFVKNGFAEPQPFNKSSVWDNLNKGKGEPTKKGRICITDWLPYKSPLQLTRETENEKL